MQSSAIVWIKETAGDNRGPVSSHMQSNISRNNPEHSKQSQLVVSAPGTVLQSGNSDPFQCMPFGVKPNMTMIVHAFHVYFLPFGLAVETRAVKPKTSKKSHNQLFKEALQDPLQAQATLTNLMTVLARESKDKKLQTQASFLKGQVLQYFQKRLTKLYSTDSSSIEILTMTRFLYAIEVEAGECTAANIHAKALSSFLSATGGLASVDLGYFEITLSTDEGHCTIHMHRSYLSFPDYTLSPLVDLLSRYIGHRPNLGMLNFPWALLDQHYDTHRTWQDLKEIIMLDSYLYSLQERLEYQAFRLLHVQRYIVQSRMLNRFYDLQDTLCRAQGTRKTTLTFQAAVAMAALYYSRFLYRDWSYLRDRNFPLDSLVSAIEQVCALTGGLSQESTRSVAEAGQSLQNPLANAFGTHPQNVSETWLWILYVGAETEHCCAAPGKLSRLFTARARAMAISTCEDMKLILAKFLYSDYMLPHLENWWMP